MSAQGSRLSAFDLGPAPWRRRMNAPSLVGQQSPDSPIGEGVVIGGGVAAVTEREFETVESPTIVGGFVSVPRGLRGVMRPGRIGLRAAEGGLGQPKQSAEPPPDGAKPVGGKGYTSSGGVAYGAGDDDGDGLDFASPRARATTQKTEQYADGDSNESERLKRDEYEMTICKWYFYLGLFALPLVHFINVWHFRRRWYADADNAHPVTKDYVKYSFFVGLCWTFIIIAWFTTFKLKFKDYQNLNIISKRVTHLFV